MHAWKTRYDINAATPVVVDGKVFISSGYNQGCALIACTAGDLEVEWENKRMRNKLSGCVLWEGHLYGFDPSILVCVDLETGERRWKGGRYGHGQLLLLPDADQLLVTTEKGDVVLVRADPERLEELARIEVLEGKTWNHPVLVGDRLYVRNGQEAAALAMPVLRDPKADDQPTL